MRRAVAAALVAAAAIGSGCSAGHTSSVAGRPPAAPSTSGPTAAASDTATSHPVVERPGHLHVRIAVETVHHLARVIGPRHATSPAFARAARWLTGRFREAGYVVHRQRFGVPGGNSWGVPVNAGRAANVVAAPQGFDPHRPHLIVGAHLDTVPQSPGAEDDASGIGVLLMLADSLAGRASVGRLPVVLIGFGAEEPRGPTDADHHYGSRAYVAALTPRERSVVHGMLALDRVGVGDVVPVCTAGDDAARARVLQAGRRAGVPTLPCTNTSSDHWSFVQQGMPGVRVGGTSYAGYHSAADVPAVVGRPQLSRTARLVLAWIR
jgi:aminopeptidase YwaD